MELFNTDLTPTAIEYGNVGEAAINTQLEQNNLDGLQQVNPNTTAETYYNPQDPQALKAKAEIAKKANNGINFQPPSTGQMFMDMLGGMLVAYGASRLLGADGNQALGVGLTAAAINHDKDREENHRFSIINDAINRNGQIYDPQDLYDFMKTGNGKGMEAAEQRKYKTDDMAATFEHQDAMQQGRFDNSQNMLAQRFNQQDKLQGERFEQQNAMQQGRFAQQEAMGKNQLSASRRGTIFNQIMDNDKPARDRYTQQYGGWTDAASQLNIIKQAQSVLDDPHASSEQKERATAVIQGAIPSLLHGVARGEVGGNATITEGQMEGALPRLGLSSNLWNKTTQQYDGTLSNEQINAIGHQIEGNRNSIRGWLNQINQNEQTALNKADNGDIEGAYSYTGANLPEPVNPDGSIQSAPTSVSQLDGTAVGAGIPEGATVEYNGTTYKNVNGKWEAQ